MTLARAILYTPGTRLTTEGRPASSGAMAHSHSTSAVRMGRSLTMMSTSILAGSLAGSTCLGYTYRKAARRQMLAWDTQKNVALISYRYTVRGATVITPTAN